jgi:signal transduction histidine kinase
MKSIQQRLTRTLLITLGVPLLAGSVVMYGLIREELSEQFDVALRARATAVAAAIRVNGADAQISSQARFIRDFEEPERAESGERGEHDGEHEDADVAYFQVRRSDGSSALRSPSLGSADLTGVDSEEPRFWNLTLPSGVPGRAVAVRLRQEAAEAVNANVDRGMSLVVATGRDDLDLTLRTVAVVLAAGCALLFGATLLILPVVTRRGLKPLDELADQTARIDANSLSTRLPVEGLPAELAPIAGRLNDLLERLEGSFERERRFTGDLAHELRTPIAELRSLAELALKWPEAREAESDRDVLAIALRMESIVMSLLRLLRSEAGQLQIAKEQLRLDELIESVWSGLNQEATGRSLCVTWSVPAGATVSTDPVLCRSIIDNILRNAVEYTPRGGRMEVTADVDGDTFDVRVTNDVGQLTESDLPRLFDRLWRLDASRSSADHTGLGLSLARAFAISIGCQLTASFEQPARLMLRFRTEHSVATGTSAAARQRTGAHGSGEYPSWNI